MENSRLEPIGKLTGKKSEMAKLQMERRSLEKPQNDSLPVIEVLSHIFSSVSFLPMAFLSSPKIGSNGNSTKVTAIRAGARR